MNTIINKEKKRGRNERCWCGSNLKYKKCHLRRDQSGIKPGSSPSLILDEAGIAGMRKAAAFNAELMDVVREQMLPGAQLDAIDSLVYGYTVDNGHTPATLGYRGFPKSCCTSVNSVVCHGIPDDYVLQNGDIVNVDLTTIVDGWHGDQSETFLIGDVSDEARAVTQCAYDCLQAGVAAIKPHRPVSDIGRAIQTLAEGRGFSVVRNFQGHGIGRQFHQDPGVPHFYDENLGKFVIKPGMCFTIEPMVNVGGYECSVGPDGWTATTDDGSLSAQFEHTILMTEDGPEILTTTKLGPSGAHTF